MERIELYDLLEQIIEVLGPEETLEAIVRAMASDELESMLEFIDGSELYVLGYKSQKKAIVWINGKEYDFVMIRNKKTECKL